MSGVRFSMRFDLADVKRQMTALQRSVLPRAVARALDRTATSERAALSSEVSTDVGIKVSAVKKAITIRKASRATLSTTVSCEGAAIPLIHFNAKGPVPSRGKGRGVTYRIGRQGRKTIASAFIATVRGPLPNGVVSPGHRGVFMRRGAKRLPIRQLYGPSLAQVFARFVPLGEERRNETLTKNLTHEIEFALSKVS